MSEVKRSGRFREFRDSSDFGTIVFVGAILLFFVTIFTYATLFPPRIREVTPLPEATTAVVSPLATTVSPSAVSPPAPSSATPSAVSTPTLTPSEVMSQPLASTPTRLVYGAVGIDLPITPLNQEGGLLNPPHVKESSYWLNQFGQPGKQAVNTTYIIAHSGEQGGWPFNALSLSSQIGDIIEVHTENGVVRFEVTNIDAYSKTTLRDNTQTPVWDIDGKRLVLISCKSGDVWQQNIVVTATML